MRNKPDDLDEKRADLKGHIINAQALCCLLLKEKMFPGYAKEIKMAVVRLDLVKDGIGECVGP